MNTPLLGLSTDDLKTMLVQAGFPAYRGAQVAQWLYHRGVHSFGDMTNLPAALREYLGATYSIGRSQVVSTTASSDGTVKLLLQLSDRNRIETVGLPYADRLSCCVSTQVGCPVGCMFCATGLSGYARNLSSGEIVDQVLQVEEYMRTHAAAGNGARTRVDHVTFMGMGEPLLNYEATLSAIHLLNGEMGIASRRLTVSTAGFVPGIYRLAREDLQLTLAVSLHAAGDELRQRLMPGMARYSISDILLACRYFIDHTGRRITFEYCLLRDVNDSKADAEALASLLHGLNCHVNLIAFNPVQGLHFSGPGREAIRRFRQTLEDAGMQVTQRQQRGADADAACGQLRRRAGSSISQ